MGARPRLSTRDFEGVWRLAHELHSVLDPEALVQFILTRLPALISSEITTFDEMCPSKAASRHWVSPENAVPVGLMPVWEHVMHAHPVLSHVLRTGDTTACRISDLDSHASFRGSLFYNEWYRRIGVEHALNTSVAASAPQGVVVGVGLHRRRKDFSERDRAVLNLLRPHLVQAYNNALVVCGLTALIEHRQGNVIVLGRDGRVLVASSQAREVLARYFPDGAVRGRGLPEELDRWVVSQLSQYGAAGKLPGQDTRWQVDRPDSRLVVELLQSGPGPVLHLMEERHSIPRDAIEAWRLTEREAEVLEWVAEGKTNNEIAGILTMRVRTVDKHCERVYQKLGVENRTAAVRRVLDSAPGIAWPLQPTHVTKGRRES